VDGFIVWDSHKRTPFEGCRGFIVYGPMGPRDGLEQLFVLQYVAAQSADGSEMKR